MNMPADSIKVSAVEPWWTPGTIEEVEKLLTPDMHAWEWGAGYSTVWMAHRVAMIIAMEHDPKWITTVGTTSRTEGVNEKLQVIQKNYETKEYKEAILKMKREFDFIIIDGHPDTRVECIDLAMAKVKKGGYVLFDDSENDYYIDIWAKVAMKKDIEIFKHTPKDRRGKHATIFRRI